jgi:hypothetical protein
MIRPKTYRGRKSTTPGGNERCTCRCPGRNPARGGWRRLPSLALNSDFQQYRNQPIYQFYQFLDPSDSEYARCHREQYRVHLQSGNLRRFIDELGRDRRSDRLHHEWVARRLRAQSKQRPSRGPGERHLRAAVRKSWVHPRIPCFRLDSTQRWLVGAIHRHLEIAYSPFRSVRVRFGCRLAPTSRLAISITIGLIRSGPLAVGWRATGGI